MNHIKLLCSISRVNLPKFVVRPLSNPLVLHSRNYHSSLYLNRSYSRFQNTNQDKYQRSNTTERKHQDISHGNIAILTNLG